MSLVLKPSALIEFLEISHSAHLDIREWCDALAEGMERVLGREVTLGMLRREVDQYAIVRLTTKVPGGVDALTGMFRESAPLLDPYFVKCPKHIISVHSVGSLVGGVPDSILDYLETAAIEDEVGLVSNAGPSVLFVSVPGLRIGDLSAQNQDTLTRLVLHKESNLRLRLDPSLEVAVVEPNGKISQIASREGMPRAELVQSHVKTVERSRTRKARNTPDALAAWTSLVDGRWGIVERIDSDGRRYYSVLETHDSRRIRALSKLEASVVELGARGLSGKAASYALGVTPATASRRLGIARQKLGFTSTSTMLRTVARFMGAGGQAQPVPLTDAEQEVLALVHLGWSNERIACERGRSENTIANQVSSILRKMNATSRRMLEQTDEDHQAVT